MDPDGRDLVIEVRTQHTRVARDRPAIAAQIGVAACADRRTIEQPYRRDSIIPTAQSIVLLAGINADVGSPVVGKVVEAGACHASR